jgi:hypothetical protein
MGSYGEGRKRPITNNQKKLTMWIVVDSQQLKYGRHVATLNCNHFQYNLLSI